MTLTNFGNNFEIEEDSNGDYVVTYTPTSTVIERIDSGDEEKILEVGTRISDLVDNTSGNTVYNSSAQEFGDGNQDADLSDVTLADIIDTASGNTVYDSSTETIGDGNQNVSVKSVDAAAQLSLPSYADNTNAVQDNESVWYNDGTGTDDSGYYAYDSGVIGPFGEGGGGIFEDTDSDGTYEQTTGTGIETPSVSTDELVSEEAIRIPSEINGESNPFSVENGILEIPVPDVSYFTVNFTELRVSSSGHDLGLQFSEDGGSTFLNNLNIYSFEQQGSDGVSRGEESSDDSIVKLAAGLSDHFAFRKAPLTIDFPGPQSAKTLRPVISWWGCVHTDNDTINRLSGSGSWRAAGNADVDMIRIFGWDSGASSVEHLSNATAEIHIAPGDLI